MLQLINRASQFDENIAIISNKEDYSYKHLLLSSQQFAHKLLDGRSDLKEARVLYMCPPGIDYVVTHWAIWMAGGIAVPLCTLHPYPSLAYVAADTQSDCIVIHPTYEVNLLKLAEEFSLRKIFFGNTGVAENTLPDLDQERGAMILYTSGTTNQPKGVVTTHKNIESQIQTLVKAWYWTSSDHILNVLPLHHVHGIINVVSSALWSGATVEFIDKFEVDQVWSIFLEERMTLFMAVPTIYYKLIKHWEDCPPALQTKYSKALTNLRLMISGSAALPIPVMEKWERISGHTLLERYGMTEIGMGLSNSYMGERRPGFVGLPLPGVALRLVDEAYQEVALGNPGEIQIKGASVFKGYWNKSSATTEAFIDGWFKTGDIAVIEDGMYRILGRNSVDIIKSGGYKISALEIENILLRHNSILECAVVGIPDEEWGEVICAALVTSMVINDEELKDWLKDKLPSYKIPRRYLEVDEIPKNALGKVTKKKVQALF